MPRPVFLCLLLALPLLGFGCKEPNYNNNQASNWRGVIQDTPKNTSKTSPTPPPTARRTTIDTETPTAPEVFILRQALSSLASADSFRAKLILPPVEGGTTPITGELLFDRNRGFRGTIDVNPQLKSDVFVINEEVYFRANTSTWQNITNQPEGARLRAFFSIAFPSEKGAKTTRVSDKARILDISEDQAQNCRRYTYSEIVPNGDLVKTNLCIKDGLPTYITNEYAEGNTEVHYSDVNQAIDIGRLE